MLRKSNLQLARFLFAFILIVLSTTQLKAQDTSETKPVDGTVQTIGDVVLYVMPVATLGTSFIIGDNQGAWQFTKGLLLTEAVTFGLKWSVNKPRPDNSNDNSFPSGHTSTVFHSAGYIHSRYGFKYAIPAYVLAGYTGASRIDSKKHDILDVLAGAAIGLGSNLIFTSEYQQEHMKLTYSNFEGNRMIGFRFEF
ncbi:phosphatase PAP2 family protein [Christiangramia sp. SM2212]|uniref:Phosphatase PAP2 family protein n=1 Tax=Christiangramia sediminicola TaxID=3073267 RepID=A0ABU1EL38_9FLAO|nr:phosphatase PAP2 family protein [Christiangramia sp. SM2212]MDR5589091.1 phosphatase PAP2 family protein [Christiangramia sp. SM2212]